MNLDNFKEFFSVENRTKYFVYVITYLLIAAILVFGLLIVGGRLSDDTRKTVGVRTPNPFEEINLEAKGVVVWDVINSRELFSRNPDLPLPLASLAKVMAAVIVSQKLKDDQEVKITREDLSPEGDSKLTVGDIWRMRDLRDFTLLTSSNDGTFALAAVAEAMNNSSSNYRQTSIDNLRNRFVEEMNNTASVIGLFNSKFFNEHGLDETPSQIASDSVVNGERSGAYGSARDMALLFEHTLKNYPEILEVTRYKNLQFTSAEEVYSAENTNTAIDKIPNLIASKTGFTDLAGGNLVVAFDVGLNRPIIVSILGSSEQGRFIDVEKLVSASLKYIHDN